MKRAEHVKVLLPFWNFIFNYNLFHIYKSWYKKRGRHKHSKKLLLFFYNLSPVTPLIMIGHRYKEIWLRGTKKFIFFKTLILAFCPHFYSTIFSPKIYMNWKKIIYRSDSIYVMFDIDWLLIQFSNCIDKFTFDAFFPFCQS